jgi:DNA-binding response OmpR family regulator
LVKPSVLIVDRSEETREVLKTALERRGVRILAAGEARRGLELAREHHPDLIVLDLEVDQSPPVEVCGPFSEQSEADQTPLVLLGSCRRSLFRGRCGEFVSKPYHFGPLVRKIEQLLEATGRPRARSA